MHPILFQIGSFTFYTHGLLAVLGIISGSTMLFFLSKKVGLKNELLFDNVVYMVLAGIVGARISYFLIYRDQFSSWREIFYLWNGGMISYGGFVFGFLAFCLLLRAQKEPIRKWLDLTAISFALGLVLGRIGNVFAGENSGIVTASRFNLSGVVPVTLYEGIIVLLIFCLLFWLFCARKMQSDGSYFMLFLLFYGGGRFIIDFWRIEPKFFLNLSLGQITDLTVFLVPVIFATFNFLKSRRKIA